MNRFRIIFVLTAALVARPVPAQDTPIVHDAAARNAIADAYHKLFLGLHGEWLDPQTSLRDVLARAPALRTELDAFVAGVALPRPVPLPGGTSKAEIQVEVKALVRALRAALPQDDPANLGATLDAFAARAGEVPLIVVGYGRDRPDLPLGLPAAVAAKLGAAAATATELHVPPIWQAAPVPARLLALEAARKDAQRQMAELVADLRLPDGATLRDLAPERELVVQDLSALLVGLREIGVYLHDGALLAEAQLAAPRDLLLFAIQQYRARFAADPRRSASQPDDKLTALLPEELRALGWGVPPQAYVRRAQARDNDALPDWVFGTIEAEGESAGGDLRTNTGKLAAARVAELAARAQLGRALADTKLPDGRPLTDLVAQRPHLTPLIRALVVDGTLGPTRFADEKATAKIGIPGMRLWKLVTDELSYGRD